MIVGHKYIILKSSWGICVNISAECKEITEISDKSHKVCENLFVKFTDKPLMQYDFYKGDMEYIIKGLKFVSKQIIENSLFENTLIEIYKLEYSLCDFQDEGITMVIMEWASKVFYFKMPEIEVNFNKSENRYIFDFIKI